MKHKTYIQFCKNGKVRVYKNNKPPTNNGVFVEETEEIKKICKKIPYKQLKYEDLQVKKKNYNKFKLLLLVGAVASLIYFIF